MRDAFVQALLNICKKDNRVYLVTGDLGFGVLKPIFDSCPSQIINAGIAEQNMTGFAAGLAIEGNVVFTYSIANFPTLRCLEQIRNDCAYHSANVKIVSIGSGLVYGPLGMSHFGTEDIGVMKSIPRVVICSPATPEEAVACTKLCYKMDGVCYIRLSRGSLLVDDVNKYNIDGFGPIIRQKGEKVAIFTHGDIYSEVLKALKHLKSNGINPSIYTFPVINPIDQASIDRFIDENEFIITIEEHNVFTGFGNSVGDYISASNKNIKFLKIGLPNDFISTVGTQEYLREIFGLDASSIAKKIISYVKEHN